MARQFYKGREGQPDMIEQDIKKLVAYGLQTGLVEKKMRFIR